MQQLREYAISARDSDVNISSARTTTPASQLTVNSPLIVIPASVDASSSSVWTTLELADQQVRQLGGQGRQSLASVGNESSFFKNDVVSEEHLCSTPSESDGIDDRVLLHQQSSSPSSDWMCTPVTLDFSPDGPMMIRDDSGQRSPPAPSALSRRRSGCLQMPQLTPIIEADNELDCNVDHNDEHGEMFIGGDSAAAAKHFEEEINNDDRQTEDNAIKSTTHHAKHHTARSDDLDLTLVTPMTSPELTPLSTCPGSSSSEETVSKNQQSNEPSKRDVDENSGAEIMTGSSFDVDNLTRQEAGQQQNKHESSYSSVYSMYTDDDTNGASADTRQWAWDDGIRARSAVSALSPRGRRLTYQKSFLNRTPIDIDMMQLPTDAVYRRRHRDHHQQLSVFGRRPGHQTGAPANLQTLADDETLPAADRIIRRRLSMYHENLI